MTAMTPAEAGARAAGPGRVDGRHERTKRTRAAIVGALAALLDEGRIEPTAVEIAKRAGVALRSIGQHFSSREELLLAVAEHHAARVAPRSIDLAAPLDDRLEQFVAANARTLEASRAMRRAAGVMIARSPAVAQALQSVAEGRRAETARVFATEIEASTNPASTERALALLTSGRSWDTLRTEMGLSRNTAKSQLRDMLRAALEC